MGPTTVHRMGPTTVHRMGPTVYPCPYTFPAGLEDRSVLDEYCSDANQNFYGIPLVQKNNLEVVMRAVWSRVHGKLSGCLPGHAGPATACLCSCLSTHSHAPVRIF